MTAAAAGSIPHQSLADDLIGGAVFTTFAGGVGAVAGTAAAASRIIFPTAVSLGGGALSGAGSGLLGQATAVALTLIFKKFEGGALSAKVYVAALIAINILSFTAAGALGALVASSVGLPITLTLALMGKMIAVNVAVGLLVNSPVLIYAYRHRAVQDAAANRL